MQGHQDSDLAVALCKNAGRVEVITFRSGVKPLDALGEWWFDKGAKGHTRR